MSIERSGPELLEHDIPTDPMQTLRTKNQKLSVKVRQFEARIRELEEQNYPPLLALY